MVHGAERQIPLKTNLLVEGIPTMLSEDRRRRPVHGIRLAKRHLRFRFYEWTRNGSGAEESAIFDTAEDMRYPPVRPAVW